MGLYILVVQVSLICGINDGKLNEYTFTAKEYKEARAKYTEEMDNVGKSSNGCTTEWVKAGHRMTKSIDKSSIK